MKTLIIAEAGVNHNGDINIAKQMISVAARSGADIVKFQTFNPVAVASKFAAKADYQNKTTNAGENQISMLEKLCLRREHYLELVERCNIERIRFLSTPFDLESIDLLERMDVPIWKIPSGEITNLPFLIKIANTGKPIILSSGMSTLDELRETVKVLLGNGAGKISVLHCNTEYPTPFEDVNLRAIETIRREIGVDVGYSDHTLGIEIPIAAVAMGATIIEKHFTLDRTMEGPDHKASIEPDELASMVKAIRNIEKAMGSGEKIPSPSERKNIDIARKSIIAARDIKSGEIFTTENITTKRPGNGISPMKWFDVLGRQASRDFKEDELIEL